MTRKICLETGPIGDTTTDHIKTVVDREGFDVEFKGEPDENLEVCGTEATLRMLTMELIGDKSPGQRSMAQSVGLLLKSKLEETR